MRDIKSLCLLGTLIFLPVLSGCCDANEPNDYAYVVGIGLDKAEQEGEYQISIQYAKPTHISGGSNGESGSGGETLGLVTVEAPTIYSGISIANNIVSKRFQLSHTKIVVMSEEIAEEGINDIMYTIVRSADLRPNMYIAVAKGSAKEYFASVQPQMEINPVKYYQLIFENKAAEFVPKNVSQNIYFYINSDEKEVVLPLVSKSKEPQKDKKEESKSGEEQKSNGETQEENIDLPKTDAKINYESFQYLMKEYVAGNVSAGKKNKSEVMGMAVFYDDKMVGEMSGIESEMYNILNGKFRYNYDSFESRNLPDKSVVMMLEQHERPSVRIDVSGESPKIDIRVKLEGNVISVPEEYILEENIYKFEKEVAGDIKNALEKFLYKTSRELGTDILGMGAYLKKSFLSYGDFEEYNWKEAYKHAEFNVDVKFNIRHTGLIIKNNQERDT